jgi:hypothetical protein
VGPVSTTPGQGGDQPYQGDNPYAGPGAYRGPNDPGRYGASPAYGQAEPYSFNPYSAPAPAGTGGEGLAPVRRPGVVVLSLVLLVLSALPFLAGGLLLLLAPVDQAEVAALLPSIDPTGQLAAAGIGPEQLVSFMRGFGAVLALLAAIYVVFAVLAFTGRGWARIVVAVLTAGFGLLMAAGLVQGGSAGAGGTFMLLVLLASVAGVVLLFLPASRAFFDSRRR